MNNYAQGILEVGYGICVLVWKNEVPVVMSLKNIEQGFILFSSVYVDTVGMENIPLSSPIA